MWEGDILHRFNQLFDPKLQDLSGFNTGFVEGLAEGHAAGKIRKGHIKSTLGGWVEYRRVASL